MKINENIASINDLALLQNIYWTMVHWTMVLYQQCYKYCNLWFSINFSVHQIQSRPVDTVIQYYIRITLLYIPSSRWFLGKKVEHISLKIRTLSYKLANTWWEGLIYHDSNTHVPSIGARTYWWPFHSNKVIVYWICWVQEYMRISGFIMRGQ